MIAFVLAAAAPLAAAHDWWLEPSRTSARSGDPIDVTLWVGARFRGDRVARDPKRIERFVALDAQGALDLVGEPGAEPAGHFLARAPGTTIVVYHSKPASLFLRAPEFEKYLAEEGLERIVALRAERGQSQKMGLERYCRCAKALVEVDGAGGPETPRGDREVGLPLEMLALDDPCALADGGELKLRITFGGKPLEGALVMALEHDHPDEILKERSDADGRVGFRLPRGGAWLVKSVHMIEAPKETKLDWESYWASLTFSTSPATQPGAAPPASTRAG
jgi:uncharacterized GH25 family protein